MLEKEAKRQGYVFSNLARNEWMEPIVKKYGYHSIEDVYAAVGYGGMTTNQVLTRLIEEYKKTIKISSPETVVKDVKRAKHQKTQETGVIVKGVDNIKVRFARCCNPVPGDKIIGYITRGRGVSVHRADCTM